MSRLGTSRAALFAALGLMSLALSGCGGGGTDADQAEPLSRTALLELLRTGIKQSGNLSGGTARSRKPANRTAKAKTRDHDNEESQYYQDEWLELWVETVSGMDEDPTGPSGDRYWIDHDKRQPGGHSFRWASASGVYPIRLKNETTILAGRFRGLYELREDTINEDDSGSATGRGVVPDEVEYTYSGSWAANRARTFSERADFADGSWQTYKLEGGLDLSPDLTIVASQGVTYKLHTNEDLSGNGTIQGDHDGLPATIVWDETGAGTITWSDGTTSPFNYFEE